MADVLTEKQIDKALAALPGWAFVDGRIQKEIRFKDFNEAFGFMTRVALVAEKMDHHPDWSNSWNVVCVGVVNHSAGGVTQQCIDFALAVEGVYRVSAEPPIESAVD
jgi:4a-hydroxytetrahydrobiopterin dehydratase